jgi:hypothetical protein
MKPLSDFLSQVRSNVNTTTRTLSSFDRSLARLLACSLSLDIVADDAVRVRRSEQFVEVVLDVVVHADRQVPLCGEREDESFFRLSKFVCGRGKEARKRR